MVNDSCRVQSTCNNEVMEYTEILGFWVNMPQAGRGRGFSFSAIRYINSQFVSESAYRRKGGAVMSLRLNC